MTDFQFRAIIKMAIEIVSKCTSIEEAVKSLYRLIGEDPPEKEEL